jgi:sentrin-specific protease 7
LSKDKFYEIIVEVPKQTNFTDCGLFLLQYVELFFMDPQKESKYPMRKLNSWFSSDVATKKRKEIATLLQRLIKENDDPLNVTRLPTLNFEAGYNWDADPM